VAAALIHRRMATGFVAPKAGLEIGRRCP